MNLKSIIIVLLAFFALTMEAQHLIVVDNSWKKERLFDKEWVRLMIPEGTAFGVNCIPSHAREWALTYNPSTKQLVYKIVEKSLWSLTFRATHEEKVNEDGTHEWLELDRPRDYVAPQVKTVTMTLTAEQAQKLENLWTTAINAAVEKEVNLLDGIKWEFFKGDKRAKSHSQNNALVKFVQELVKAVNTGDVGRKDSLIDSELPRL